MHTRYNVLSSFASFSMVAQLCEADVSYEQTIKKERAELAARLKGKDSPFALVGGFNIFGAGISTIGRDATCSHVVRSAQAPDRVGELTVIEGKMEGSRLCVLPIRRSDLDVDPAGIADVYTAPVFRLRGHHQWS